MDEFRFDTRAVQPFTDASNPQNTLGDLEARLAALEDGLRPSVSSVTTQFDSAEEGEAETPLRQTSPNSHHLEPAWALAFRSGAAAIDVVARLLRPGDR
jgi:hypothetical protein